MPRMRRNRAGERRSLQVLPLAYEPYESLEDRPHVMVDGAARRSSVVTLSHWPGSPTPASLAHDLSAEIVIGFLRSAASFATAPASSQEAADVGALAARLESAEAVTNDHFDEDGLMSVLAFADPELAMGLDQLIVEVASCGDFGVVSSDVAAQISFAIGPLAAAEAGDGAATSQLYGAVLPRVPELLEHPARFARWWKHEFAAFVAAREAIASGHLLMSDVPAADLCVVQRAAGDASLNEVAVNSSTSHSRVLTIDGDSCVLTLRYEGWVRYVSRPIPLRPDLEPLAALLAAEEPSGVTWEADGVGAIVGRLAPAGEGRTEIAPDRVIEIVAAYLSSAAPAWDPWRAGGGYIPEQERAAYVAGDR